MPLESTAIGTDVVCSLCGHEQVAIPDSFRAVLGLVAEVNTAYCEELEKGCAELELDYRWSMTIEVAAYVLMVLDFAMFRQEQTGSTRELINRLAEQVVLPFEEQRFAKAIDHRLHAFGRALSGKPIAEGLVACHAIMANYLLAAPQHLGEVPTGDIPLRVVDAFMSFRLRSLMVEIDRAVILPFGRALASIFSTADDIAVLSGATVDRLIAAAYGHVS